MFIRGEMFVIIHTILIRLETSFYFGRGGYFYVALVGLEFSKHTGLTLNSSLFCLCLPGAESVVTMHKEEYNTN